VEIRGEGGGLELVEPRTAQRSLTDDDVPVGGEPRRHGEEYDHRLTERCQHVILCRRGAERLRQLRRDGTEGVVDGGSPELRLGAEVMVDEVVADTEPTRQL